MGQAIDMDRRRLVQIAATTEEMKFGILASVLSERRRVAEVILKTTDETVLKQCNELLDYHNEYIKKLIGL